MLCKICAVQVQREYHVLHDEEYTDPTRQHELDRWTIQITNISARKDLEIEVGIDTLSEVFSVLTLLMFLIDASS